MGMGSLCCPSKEITPWRLPGLAQRLRTISTFANVTPAPVPQTGLNTIYSGSFQREEVVGP